MMKPTKRRGSLFIEALIAMVIFLIGVLGLMSVMTTSLKVINRSGDVIKADQEIFNSLDSYMLLRTFSHTQNPSGVNVQKIAGVQKLDVGDLKLNCAIYKYTRFGKKANSFEVLQREK